MFGYIYKNILIFGILISSQAYAWGERGHDLITKLAVRLLTQETKQTPIAKLFLQKENMLGHYSNVPDIVWRNRSDADKKANAHTHYIDLEYLLPEAQADTDKMPQTVIAFLEQVKAKCQDSSLTCRNMKTKAEIFSVTGSGPFRVRQLTQQLETLFKKVRLFEDNKDLSQKNNLTHYIATIDRTLLLAGLLSHFVGDLANPNHTTQNYDGAKSGNRGIHAYFETLIVNSFSLNLDGELEQFTQEHPPNFLNSQLSYLDIAWSLTKDSFNKNHIIFNIDKKYAQKQNKDQTITRKPPKKVHKYFKDIIHDRMSAASHSLKRLWVKAWEKGNKPQFKYYKSFHYDTSPDFIYPNYK